MPHPSIFLFVFSAVSISLCFGLEFPSDVQRCKSGDVECICKVANELVRQYPKGRADLGVPPIDPYFLNQTVDLSDPIANDTSANDTYRRHLDLKFRDIQVIGLSTQDFQRCVGFTNDPYTSKFELYGRIPKLIVKGGYYLAYGRVLTVPLKGTGNFSLTFEDVDGAVIFKPMVEKVENGKHYMRLDQINVELKPEKVRIQFYNLFNGSKELGDLVNRLLNENIKEVWNDMYPRAMNATEAAMKDIIDKIISQFAYEDIYLD